MSKKQIEECVRISLEGYFKDLRGTDPDGMYDMMVRVVEKPLLEVVMNHAEKDRKSTRLNSSHVVTSRMPSSA